jgi:hypothetical protein
MDIKELIPKHKSDIEPIDKLKLHSYEDVKSIIPELLVCLQDGHWDIAEPAAMFLQTIAPHITEEIIKILQTNDEQWKHQCIRWFGFDTQDILLRNEIRRIALHPTKNEIEDLVQEIAEEAM